MNNNVNLSDPAALSSVLALLSVNDTEAVKQGEKMLKPFLKKKDCVFHLVTQLEHSVDASIRLHAALLLKKKIGALLGKFPADQQASIKAKVISLMLSETNKGVYTAIAGSVSVMAKNLFSAGDMWPELFALMMQLSQDPTDGRRALNFSLLEQLAETVPQNLKPHTVTLAQMFSMGCQDSAQNVAMAALSATGVYINALGGADEIMIMKDVIPPMLNVMNMCLQNGEDDVICEAFDVLQECCILDQPLINEHIQVVTAFSINIIQHSEYEAAVKQSAGQTLLYIIEYRPKFFANNQLVSPTLAALMEMIAKEDASAAGSLFSIQHPEGVLGDDNDDEDYSPEVDVQRLAQTIIDCMAVNIPSKHFVDPALVLCGQGVASPDPNMRKAGAAVLGVIAEGCADRIREILPEILPRLLSLVQDPEFFVRECACFALGQFSEYCQPDILYHSSTILPAIFSALDDPLQSVQSTSCYVLEVFCENLQPQTLKPYLMPLMTKLAVLLQSSQKQTREMALSAIAACAVAAEIEFLPFTESVCNLLGQLVFDTEPNNLTTRGRALECLGHVAVAIGGDNFSRYFDEGMRSAIQATQMKDESLKEYSYVYVANCAKVMEHKFENYLPSLIPHLLEVISENELMTFEKPELVEGDDTDDDDADITSDDDGDDVHLNIQEGFVNTKKAALTALGALAEHTKALFYPYIESTIKTLLAEGNGSINSLHGTIRAESYGILQHIVASACISHGISESPPPKTVLPLNEALAAIANVAISANVQCLKEDQYKSVVAESCTSIMGIVSRMGVVVLNLPTADGTPLVNQLMHNIYEILCEKSPCQVAARVEADGVADDDDEDHDNIVMDTVTDLIGVLAKCMGDAFIPYFDQFQKPLLKFMKPSRIHTDRAMSIGTFAEVIAVVGPEAIKYAPIILPVILNGVSDNMEGVRRNSAYCCGVLIESTGSGLSSEILNILQKLHPLCIRKESQKQSDCGGADVDNALAAVARIINTAPPGLIPLDHVLPVMLSSLPLREDYSEGPYIYQCLAQLILTNNTAAIALLPAILSSFGECLANISSTDTSKSIVKTCLRHLTTLPEYPTAYIPAMNQITDSVISSAIQSALT